METEVKWIKVSTSLFDDEKIKLIRSMPEGDSMIVIWLQLLLLAGRVNQDGMLVVSSTEIPYTEEMLSTHFDMKLNTVLVAMEAFRRFGMIDIVDDIYHITNWAKHQKADANTKTVEHIREQNRTRKQIQREREKAKELPSPPLMSLPEPVTAETVAEIPLIHPGETHPITKEDVRKYQDLYPGIDTMQEIKKMVGWCDANPKLRKTRSGVKRFINSWLSRAQDRAPRLYPGTETPSDGPRSLATRGLENWD